MIGISSSMFLGNVKYGFAILCHMQCVEVLCNENEVHFCLLAAM